MDLKSLATQVLMNKIGNANNAGDAESALGDLLGGGKEFNIVDIVGKFTNSGGDLADKAKSWLGDGANEAISATQVKEVIGGEQIEAFAKKLGIGRDEASESLSEILPELIDKSSSGGNLLNSLGGTSGLAKLASRFFK